MCSSDLTVVETQRHPAGGRIFARGEAGDVLYLLRRGRVRILLPLGVAMGLSLACRTRAVYPAWELFVHAPGTWIVRLAENPGIIWSLIAEMVYYALYPALNRLGTRFGWGTVYAASAVLAMGIGILQPNASLNDLPIPASWLSSLPPWILGCWMAEVHARGWAPAPWMCRRSLLRALVLGCSVAEKALGSAAGLLGGKSIPMHWVFWIFPLASWICVLWLNAEIEGFRRKPPPAWLESLGTWSFSLYLVHVIVRDVWAVYVPDPTAFGTRLATNLLRLLAALAIAYGFARLVEFPSMRLAQWASRRVGRPSPQG